MDYLNAQEHCLRASVVDKLNITVTPAPTVQVEIQFSSFCHSLCRSFTLNIRDSPPPQSVSFPFVLYCILGSKQSSLK